MTTLNIQRMKQYAKWQLACHRTMLLKMTAVTASTFTIMFLFVTYVNGNDFFGQENDLTLLLGFTFIICGSWIFPHLESKQNRTTLLMLPATNGEKFITSYIGVMLTAFAAETVAFVAADLVQWVISLMLNYKSAMLITPLAIKNLFDALTPQGSIPDNFFGVMLLLWLHSFYLLCGVFFKKRPTLWGTIGLGVLSIVFTAVMGLAGVVYLHVLKESDVYSIELLPWAEEAIKIGACIFAVLLVAGNYALAYRIFCKLQVINNRFFNW